MVSLVALIDKQGPSIARRTNCDRRESGPAQTQKLPGRKTDLTLTGFLMEGLDTQNLAMYFGALCRGQEKRTMRETEIPSWKFQDQTGNPRRRMNKKT
jgi:hypothetical protein